MKKIRQKNGLASSDMTPDLLAVIPPEYRRLLSENGLSKTGKSITDNPSPVELFRLQRALTRLDALEGAVNRQLDRLKVPDGIFSLDPDPDRLAEWRKYCTPQQQQAGKDLSLLLVQLRMVKHFLTQQQPLSAINALLEAFQDIIIAHTVAGAGLYAGGKVSREARSPSPEQKADWQRKVNEQHEKRPKWSAYQVHRKVGELVNVSYKRIERHTTWPTNADEK